MRIVAISDTHSRHQDVQIPDGDVLIHCGDICGHGHNSEVKKFLKWFQAHPHQHKIFIAGNHDRCLEAHYEAGRRPDYIPEDVTYLLDEEIVIDGLKFYGAPWTPFFCDWAFMRGRGKFMAERWAKIPDDVDVLITHGPPFGVLDKCSPYMSKGLNRLVGCFDLLQRVIEIQPKVHLFGHIHGGHGQTLGWDQLPTLFVNAATCTEDYKPTQPAQIIDL